VSEPVPQLPASSDLDLRGRLLVVTGKGGVGKTTVALAIAVAAERAGKKVLLIQDDFEPTTHSSLLGYYQLDTIYYEPLAVSAGVSLVKIDPESAMREMFTEILKVPNLIFEGVFRRRLSRALFNAIPGVREIFIIGKVWSEAFQFNAYDLVVWDAPPSGQIAFYLTIPSLMESALRIGPIASNCRRMLADLGSPERCKALVVTLAEALAVNEANQLQEELRKRTVVKLGGVLANKVLETVEWSLRTREEDGRTLEDLVRALTPDPDQQGLVLGRARLLEDRYRSAMRQLERLSAPTGVPVLGLPLMVPTPGQGLEQIIDALARRISDHARFD